MLKPRGFVCSYGAKTGQNTQEGKTRMQESKLLNIYGARISRNGDHINITLVEGEGDKKTYYNACVKIAKEGKTYGSVEGNKAYIVIPLLKDPSKPKEVNLNDFKDKCEELDDFDKIDLDDVPF